MAANRLHVALFLTASFTLLGRVVLAAEPKEVSPIEIGDSIKAAKDAVSVIGLQQGDFVIDGDKAFDGWFLAVERLVFKPSGKLIFSQEALSKRDSFFIVAREIVASDPSKPGTITWVRGDGPGIAPPQSGQAPTGRHATEDDDSGGKGGEGTQGNPGYPGRNAPSLTIFAQKITGSGAYLGYKGQSGGKGGTGQRGGDGGNGAKGHPASQSLFDCKRGPGNGGDGGPGGPGGVGGVGGTGGNGGRVTVISLTDNLPLMTQLFRVDVDPGAPGVGGDGGPGGNGGLGGPVGQEALPYCKKGDRHDGSHGTSGSPGASGPIGKSSVPGDFFVSGLSQTQFDKVFGGS